MAKKAQSELRKKIKAFEQTRKDLTKTLKTELTSILKDEIWDKFPKLESFAWTQYTPYFNDGDTCEFGVRNDEIDITYNGIDFDYVGQYSFTSYKGESQDTEEARQPLFKECYEAINGLLKSIPEELYKEGFGDHVRVTVTANGVDVDDYDHD